MINHELNIIQDCDNILVFKNGKIVEQVHMKN